MCKKNILTVVAVAILALAIGQVQAVTVTVPIDNPGFEDPVLADGEYDYSLDNQGWGYFDNDGYQGSWNPGLPGTSYPGYGGSAPEGQNVGFTNPGGVGVPGGLAQVLTDPDAVLKAGVTYTLTVEVGNTLGYPWGGYSVQLLAGGTPHTPGTGADTGPVTGGILLAEDNNSLTIAEDTIKTSTVTYTYNPELHLGLLGEPLQIRLLSLGNVAAGDWTEADFDNVILSYYYDPAIATNPNPADKATDVCPKLVLSWTPGAFVGALSPKHKVFFSENFDDVNDGVGGTVQDANTYDPAGLLKFGTTYYWRIDEANSVSGWDQGDIWQFTTEPFAYPIDGNNITATASSSDPGQGPENTVNRSGLDANDLHSTEMSDMWLSNIVDTNPAWIQYEFDKVYKLHQMWVWNHNTAFEGLVGFGFKDVTIEYSTNGTDWTVLAGVTEFARGTGLPDYAYNTPVDFDGAVAKYVKITANSNWSAGATTQYGLSEVRFFYMPVRARKPNPMDEAAGVGPDVVLNWRAGREAAEHNAYVSTKRQAVINGTAAVTNIPAAGECLASHDAGTLELGKTYYWKITEVNMAETPTMWEGDVWSFATPEYFVVEDFEDYNDYPPDRIFETWKGGYGYTGYCGNGTGSAVGHAKEPYAEQTIVHGGRQSMPVYYDNSATGTNSCGQPINLYYSETERTFDTPQDWTRAGVRALTLYFYGDPNNTAGATERIYVKVNGAKVVYDGDAADIKQAGWHEWNIDLASFGGVNLQNVTKVSIGIGNGTGPGGSGVLYFDDIRLYPPRCVPGRKEPPAADLNNDCRVDYKELEVMAANWLAVAAAPSNANLVGWWKFEEASGALNDESDHNNDGTGNGVVYQRAGQDGYALGFDGIDDTVVVGANGRPSDTFTFGGWFKTSSTHQIDAESTTGTGGTSGQRYAFDPAHGGDSDGGAGLSVGTNGISVYEHGSYYMPATAVYAAEIGDEWNHIMVVYNNKQPTIYLNGEAVRTGLTSPRATVIAPIQFGGMGYGYFEGLMDDVRIYSVVLTDVEILGLALRIDLYEDMKIDLKDFAELAGWWLDEQLWP